MHEQPTPSPAQETLQTAANAGEAIRALNHLTRGIDLYPADVYRIIAELQALTARMPQLLGQVTLILERALQGRQLRVNGGQHRNDPFAAVTAAADALAQAQLTAGQLPQQLDEAQQATAWISEDTPCPADD